MVNGIQEVVGSIPSSSTKDWFKYRPSWPTLAWRFCFYRFFVVHLSKRILMNLNIGDINLRLRIILIGLLAILLLSTATFAEDKFRFTVFSDTRGKVITKSCLDDNAGVSSILPLVRDHVIKINETKPIQLVLFPGDMITGYFPRDAGSTSECNRIQLSKWREVMKPLLDKGILVRVTVGNHEVGKSDPSKEDILCGETWPTIFAVIRQLSGLQGHSRGHVGRRQ